MTWTKSIPDSCVMSVKRTAGISATGGSRSWGAIGGVSGSDGGTGRRQIQAVTAAAMAAPTARTARDRRSARPMTASSRVSSSGSSRKGGTGPFIRGLGSRRGSRGREILQGINGNPFGGAVGRGVFFSGRGHGPVAGVVVGLVTGMQGAMPGCLLNVAKLAVQQRQIIVRVDILRIERQRLLKLPDGFIQQRLAGLRAPEPRSCLARSKSVSPRRSITT